MSAPQREDGDAYAGIPRERIPWYPTIDAERCRPDACALNCISWCQKDVYAREASGRVVVARPYACTVGDISCSMQCPFDAIAFPSQRELRRTLRALRQEIDRS